MPLSLGPAWGSSLASQSGGRKKQEELEEKEEEVEEEAIAFFETFFFFPIAPLSWSKRAACSIYVKPRPIGFPSPLLDADTIKLRSK